MIHIRLVTQKAHLGGAVEGSGRLVLWFYAWCFTHSASGPGSPTYGTITSIVPIRV